MSDELPSRTAFSNEETGQGEARPGSGGDRPGPVKAKKSELREMVEIIVIALLIALLIRHFLVEVFVVDGRSMEPTLSTGERLLVNKLVYRFREPGQGEIIVFRYPRNPRRDFIKRVVAVGGDTVHIVDGRVFVNEQQLDEWYVLHADHLSYGPYTVPANTVFVLGDNRLNSEDSRSFQEVSLRSVKGRVLLRFWPPRRFQLFTADPAT